MKKGIVPRSGIDTADAKWGFSHIKGWIFGYKLHLISSTGSAAAAATTTVVPLAADFTTANNVQDNQLYNPMTESSSSFLSTETCFMIGDSGYDDQKLYDLSINRGFELVCPVQKDMNIPLLTD
jgi:Transposase DDE domain